jgi:DNA processing protein
MADATVVIEAAKSGGALITADMANSYNREVFTIPGRIGDTWSEGCNLLIRDNKAALIQSATDIAKMMGWEKKKQNVKQHLLFVNLTPDEKKIISLMRGNGEMGIDEITLQSRLNMSKVAAALLNLEFNGIVKALPGKIYKFIG